MADEMIRQHHEIVAGILVGLDHLVGLRGRHRTASNGYGGCRARSGREARRAKVRSCDRPAGQLHRICMPSSTTRSGGMRKNSMARADWLASMMNRRCCQKGMRATGRGADGRGGRGNRKPGADRWTRPIGLAERAARPARRAAPCSRNAPRPAKRRAAASSPTRARRVGTRGSSLVSTVMKTRMSCSTRLCFRLCISALGA